ncbi:hypothetical protein Bca52824_096788, partial [Brassica carinata]
MTLIEGMPLLYQQFTALFKKNLLLSWRNKSATCLHLFSSFFFIFLIFCIQEAMKASDSRRVSDIVSAIMANNPGRPILTNKVKSFKGPEEVDAWFTSHPLHAPGALHFTERNATVISYGVQTNSSSATKRGRTEDPTFKFLVPLQIAAEREIARFLVGDLNAFYICIIIIRSKFGWSFGFKEFAQPAVAKDVTISPLNLMGPVFFLAFSMFGFVLQLGSLATEKELKLRQAMTVMGVYDTAYWLSWLIWEGILTFVSSLFLVLFGMMFQFDFFLKNSFFVVFLLFLLFQFNMISLAFMLSSFISKSSSATTVGFLVFLIGFITQTVATSGFPYSSTHSLSAGDLVILSTQYLFCWVAAAYQATSVPEALELVGNKIYIWLVGTFFFWFVLAIYFDNIIPNASGVRKTIFYFLKPSYWTGKEGNKVEGSICSCFGSVPPVEHLTPDDQDVLEEETLVKKKQWMEQLILTLLFRFMVLLRCILERQSLVVANAPKHPLSCCKAKDQLFCLLGPNGAGKTTTISCLTGINPVTGGDALIYGDSIRSSVGMSNIRKMIVCPQFDILWDALSSEEHLHLFASIKGLPPASIKTIAEKLLADVKLTGAAKIRAGSYSGGMKRRLSVAIALIGDPKLVFLDEP